MRERVDSTSFTSDNYEEFKIAALIILNLSSKFLDRISYSISDLLRKIGFSKPIPSPEVLRQYEAEVLRALDFNLSIKQDMNLHESIS